MRIGFDIDGVLADFNPAYIALLNKIQPGVNAPLDYQPQRWHYEGDLGFSKETVTEAWKQIGESMMFWINLGPLPNPREVFRMLNRNLDCHDIYFITARPGTNSKGQTEGWLFIHGIEQPTVLISKEKGLCAKALDLELYIDDRTENIQDVQIASPSTRAYLINRPYNVGGDVLRRANTVSEVFEREGLNG